MCAAATLTVCGGTQTCRVNIVHNEVHCVFINPQKCPDQLIQISIKIFWCDGEPVQPVLAEPGGAGAAPPLLRPRPRQRRGAADRVRGDGGGARPRHGPHVLCGHRVALGPRHAGAAAAAVPATAVERQHRARDGSLPPAGRQDGPRLVSVHS